MELIGAIVTLIGSLVLLIAAIGLIRMPDVYNRLQVGTKASTLGTILTLFGLLLIVPAWSGKLVLLILFIMMTNPVSSHVLARASYFIKIPLTNRTIIDKLNLDKKIIEVAVEDSKEIKRESLKL
jgi:multicomponent Na+:H+ antiporter subunit G